MLHHERRTELDILPNRGSGSLPAAGLRGVSDVDADAMRQLGMTLNQFALFVAVAKFSNVTKASAELRVSQPSVSQQLRQLELSYGAKLYRRVSKGIEITEAGQLFLRKIIPILVQVAKLGNGHKSLPTKTRAPEILTVGGIFSASAVLLPSLLARLQQRYPKAALEFRTGTSEHLERLVRNSAVDMAVTDREAPSEELFSDLLRREKVVAFVLPGHSLARRKIVRLADLIAEPLIIRGGKGISGRTESALKRLRDQGMEVNIGMRCDGPAAIKAAVRQKMGVGIAFEDSVRAEIDSGEFKILQVRGLDLEAKSFIVYPKKRPLSPLAQEFLELLRDARTKRRKFDSAPPDKRWSIRMRVDPLVESRMAV